MINYFRKTRKKLADANKPLKYMRYAIGEIILVVIGILIALQVNNWNEERKERLAERRFLISLNEDLDRNKELIKRRISTYTFLRGNMEFLINAYTDKSNYNDTLNGYFHLSRVFTTPQLSLSAYEEIKLKGMDRIESPILRKKIVDLF